MAVRKFERCNRMVIVMAAAAIFVGVAMGDTQGQSQAKEMLGQAIAQYERHDLTVAKETFGKIDMLNLSEADATVLRGYQSRIKSDIEQQEVAAAAFETASVALEADDLDKSEAGFTAAVNCQLLQTDKRQEAQNQLVVIRQKRQLIAAKNGELASVASINTTDIQLQAAAPAADAAAAPAEEKKAEPASAPAAAPAAAAPAEEKKAEPATAPAAVPAAAPAEEKKAEPAAEKTAEKPAEAPVTATANATDAAGPSQDQAKRIRASEKVSEGKKALSEGNALRASDLADMALLLDPDSQEAKKLKEDAKLAVGGTGGSQILSTMEQKLRVQKAIVETDYKRELTTANEELAKGSAGGGKKENFEAADRAAQQAQQIIRNNQHLFSASDYSERMTAIDTLREHIANQKDSFNRERTAQMIQQINKDVQDRQNAANQARNKTIATLRQRAMTLQAESKYKEAVGVLQEIINIDPQNDFANTTIGMLKSYIVLQEERETVMDQRIEEHKQFVDLRWSEVPWYALVTFPKDWKQLSARRDALTRQAQQESAEDRKVMLKMGEILKSVPLTGVQFSDAIEFLRTRSDLNFNVRWPALTAAGIGKDKQLTISLVNVSIKKCLESILNDVSGGTTANIGWAISDGVIEISTKEDLAKDKGPPRVYDIRDLIMSIPTFQGPRIDIATISSITTGGGGGLFQPPATTTNAPTRDDMINRIQNVIQNTVAPNSWSDGTGSMSELNGNLIISQTPENHSKILTVLKGLREAQALQVAIEARFITIDSGFLNRIGVDLDFYFNLGSKLGSNLVRDPATGAINGGQVWDPWTGAFVPTDGSPWTGETRNPQWATQHRWTNKLTPIPVNFNSADFTRGLQTNVAQNIGNLVGNTNGMSVAGTFLNDVQVDFLLEATQAHIGSRQLTAPRVTLFNGQRAYVLVTSQQAYISLISQTAGTGAVANNYTVSWIPSGSMLDADVTVSADRRYVTMTVRPQITNSVINRSSQGIDLPTVTINELETTVSVPDGGTLLMGGQKQSSEVEREMGVPVISKIPILNRGTTNRAKVRDERTLVVLIKPKIIIQSEYEQDQFP